MGISRRGRVEPLAGERCYNYFSSQRDDAYATSASTPIPRAEPCYNAQSRFTCFKQRHQEINERKVKKLLYTH